MIGRERLGWMPTPMKVNESPNPTQVRLAGSRTEAANRQRIPNAVKEPRGRDTRRGTWTGARRHNSVQAERVLRPRAAFSTD